MKKLRFAACIFALSIPVSTTMAQNAPPTPPAAPEPPPSAADAPAPAPAAALEEKINADFPKYDKDKSGELNKSEFSTWISEARTNAGGEAPDTKTLGDAFLKADTDSNKTVSAKELASFLS
jgi:hypothetical protein